MIESELKKLSTPELIKIRDDLARKKDRLLLLLIEKEKQICDKNIINAKKGIDTLPCLSAKELTDTLGPSYNIRNINGGDRYEPNK